MCAQTCRNVPSSVEHSPGVPWSPLEAKKKKQLLLQQVVTLGEVSEIWQVAFISIARL